jgi:carbohydrate-selective porin OprB
MGEGRPGRRDAQVVSGYLGGGIVRKGVLASRPEDLPGFTASRAAIAPDAQHLQGLRAAETTWGTTYQIKAADLIAVEPDVQCVVHPSL